MKKLILFVIIFILLLISIIFLGTKLLYNPTYINLVYGDIEDTGVSDMLDGRVIAHALGNVDDLYTPNTLEAFNASYEAGARVFEIDLTMTSDGVVVASHDFDTLGYIPSYNEFSSLGGGGLTLILI